MVGGVGMVNDIFLKISVILSLFEMTEIYKGGGGREMISVFSLSKNQ